MTRKVVYLTDAGLVHGQHSVHFGYRGAGKGLTMTADGGVALPEGSDIEVVYCRECEEHLRKGDDYTVQDRFLFEIEEFSGEPWKGDEPWKT